MTFRQSALALAAPVLAIVLVGCQPPLEEKPKDGATATSGAGEKMTPPPVSSTPTDAKPTEAAPTPSPEAGKDAAPAPAPADLKPEAPNPK